CLYCPMQPHCQAHQQGQENELPYKQAKKTVPDKSAQVLILQCDQQRLWQQRPNSGLWGGLWCLPIIEDSQEFERLRQGLSLKQNVKKVEISHSFTHFTWQLEGLVFAIEADLQEHLAIELNGIWLEPVAAVQ